MALVNVTQHPLPLVNQGSSTTPRLFKGTRTTPTQIRAAASNTSDMGVARRTAEYAPCSWSNEYIQSFKSDFQDETSSTVHEHLVRRTRNRFGEIKDPVALTYFVDTLQKLGIAYHFNESIDRALQFIYSHSEDTFKQGSLHLVSTMFRLLRGSGYEVSQDVFKRFLGLEYRLDSLQYSQIQDLLSLYEASFLSHEGETLLDEAREISSRLLNDIQEHVHDATLKEKVAHSLEIPTHRRPIRLEQHWFIKIYAYQMDKDPLLLELAQLDFNMLQSMHRDEIKRLSRWWKEMELSDNINFFRDRLVESWYLVMEIMSHEPQFSSCREHMTKIFVILPVLDDFYDVYGTMDEIELFTSCIDKWDMNMIEKLPQYLKIVFLVLFNSTNKLAYDILIKNHIDITDNLKEQISNYCKALYTEAKWYHSQYIPSFDEYLDNGVYSSSIPLLVSLVSLINYGDVNNEFKDLQTTRNAGIITRLMDDVGTSKDEIQRGDSPKGVQCYMHQEGVIEAEALDHMRNLIDDLWKQMNYERFSNSYMPRLLISNAINCVRVGHFVYLKGDGFGAPCKTIKEQFKSLLFEYLPIGG